MTEHENRDINEHEVSLESSRQAGRVIRNLGEHARSAIADAEATAQKFARRTREQAAMATDVLNQQSTRAGKYLSHNINEYPFSALLIAGAIGYGLAYLIHTQRQNRPEIEQVRNSGGGLTEFDLC